MRGDIRPPKRVKRPAQPSSARRPIAPPRSAPDRKSNQLRPAPNLIGKRPSSGFRPKVAVTAALVLLAAAAVGVHARDSVTETRGDVAASVEVAQQSFKAAEADMKSMDIAGAEREFGTAETSLGHANQQLAGKGLVGGLAAGQASGDIRTSQQLLATAQETAKTGHELVIEIRRAGEETAKSDQGFFRAGEIAQAYLPRIDQKLSELDHQLGTLEYLRQRASDSSNPELSSAAAKFDDVLPSARKAVGQAREVAGALPDFLGHDQFTRYILLFQNPAELRPTGGFTGTIGQLTLDDGAVKELNIESIYNPANQARLSAHEDAPGPLERPTNGDPSTKIQWFMQDANWNPNFPTSAEKYQYFYEKSGGPSTDGVIAVTASPVIEILRIIGPIEQPDVGETITADSFYETIANYQKTNAIAGNDPKTLLRDFLPKLLEKIRQAPADQQQKVRQIMAESLKAKDVQLSFNDDRLQKFVNRAGLGGQLDVGPGELALVEANLAANKSSADVSVSLDRDLEIGSNGTVDGTLALTRTYDGTTNTLINGTFTRLYLPKGTSVDATDGWADYAPSNVDTEGNYTVISGWTDVNPGETRIIHANYQLPDKVDLRTGEFPLTFWRQAGSNVNLTTKVTLPDGYTWDGVPGAVVTGNVITFNEPVRSDIVHRLTFKKR
ncbi:DUF4012 domain-containing protein [Patescibacteria group bacterium]|nr:DUF4012 domain-containing protein [Patescibacteria group bacterium]